MELYLDSADINEIKEAFKLGFLAGLTTTPTFMYRHGITDIDGTIVELSKIVPILQIEALGETAEEIIAEAKRQDALGLDKTKTVYKIPISLEGLKACKALRNENFLVNIHLIYTLQQAYMAMEAGATYVCPLVGRLQDQGTDALNVVEQIVDACTYYDYDTKVMFSSIRNVEHVRNALNVGVDTVTVPWSIIKQLTKNHFTDIGTKQFFEHTRLMTMCVEDIMKPINPVVSIDTPLTDGLLKMTSDGFGAVTIVNLDNTVKGIFTDGDLRRLVAEDKENLNTYKMGNLITKPPFFIEKETLLIEAQKLFTEKQINHLVVISPKNEPLGMINLQDIINM